MRARAWFAAVGLWAGAAAADPKPTPVDLEPLKDKLTVYQDAQGGTYIVVRGDDKRVFYGTGKILYEQWVIGGGANGDAWSISTWAPRIEGIHPAAIEHKQDGSFMRSCWGHDDVGITEITGDKAKAALDKVTVMTEFLVRRPYLLARDEGGIYYYVDVLRQAYGGKGYRVFVGKKGAMKERPLTDVTSDQGGDVFATKTGELRFVRTVDDETGKSTLSWVRGEKRTKLINLDVDAHSAVIFKDLGVYSFTGTLCENI
jgi:hypothetical protein